MQLEGERDPVSWSLQFNVRVLYVLGQVFLTLVLTAGSEVRYLWIRKVFLSLVILYDLPKKKVVCCKIKNTLLGKALDL